jgi:hypothetical protein
MKSGIRRGVSAILIVSLISSCARMTELRTYRTRADLRFMADCVKKYRIRQGTYPESQPMEELGTLLYRGQCLPVRLYG